MAARGVPGSFFLVRCLAFLSVIFWTVKCATYRFLSVIFLACFYDPLFFCFDALLFGALRCFLGGSFFECQKSDTYFRYF